MSRYRYPITLALGSIAFAALATLASAQGNGPASNPLVRNSPDAIVDLRGSKTAKLVAAQWRTSPLVVRESELNAPGKDLKPSGPPHATLDVANSAFAADFDDSSWESISPDSLEARRSTGRLAGQWYRLRITLPESIGDFPVMGAVVALEVTVDDYAEIAVDGRLPLVLGGTPGAIAGWNTPQRVVLTNDATPGRSFEIAFLAHNGPLGAPPENFVWFRSATLDLYSKSRWRRAEDATLSVERADAALDAIVGANARLEKIATGFQFTEGPTALPDGSILFSDPNRNVIYRYADDDDVSLYRAKSGYSGVDIGLYRQPGSNGLALDSDGRLTICEHGNRRITRLEKNGVLTVLADSFEGKRLNSPNDLVYRKDGVLFFTDPPFGLPGFHDDPRRELPHFGVYALKAGRLSLIDAGLRGPNGLDLSPDERFLYVANWDEAKKTVTRYAIGADASVTESTLFADLTKEPGEEALDGLEVDNAGNVFVSGPGGVFVFASSGKKLGRLVFPELPANFIFTDSATKTMILAARTGLYRLSL